MEIDNTVNALKQIIDREGVNYLSTNSYAVYIELLDKRQADPKMARLILITLLAGVQEENTQDMKAVSAYILQIFQYESSILRFWTAEECLPAVL